MKTPTGKEIVEDQVIEEGRVICSCGIAVLEDEWLQEQKRCLYCWEDERKKRMHIYELWEKVGKGRYTRVCQREFNGPDPQAGDIVELDIEDIWIVDGRYYRATGSVFLIVHRYEG